jgi:hypothetical protein
MAAADNHDMQTFQARQSYDYRIREAICETGDRDLFPELKIPPCEVGFAAECLMSSRTISPLVIVPIWLLRFGN